VASLDGGGGRQGRNVFSDEGEQFGGDRRNTLQLFYILLSLFEGDGFLGLRPVVPGGDLSFGLVTSSSLTFVWHNFHESRGEGRREKREGDCGGCLAPR